MSGKRYYDAKFYRELEQTRESARETLPLVLDWVQPTSVADIGCGAGHWLAIAMELGVKDIVGVEGEWIRDVNLAVPPEKIITHDLRLPLTLDRRFDLVISLEVAEHLPPEHASSFVQLLCEAGDVVLFSAAIPGQGGRNHLNEQWPEYWARLFQEHGYRCYDVVRQRIWNNPRVLWYYAQNCMMFAPQGASRALENTKAMPSSSSSAPLSLVHPQLWSDQLAHWNSPGKLLERLVKSFIQRG